MKPDNENGGLANVKPSNVTPIPPRRSEPMRLATERPTAEQLTPQPLGDTSKIKAEFQSAVQPIFDKIAYDERSQAATVVNNLLPRAIAARSAQSPDRIAANVRSIVQEVEADALATFPGVDASNSVKLVDMADALFAEMFPDWLAV